MASAKPVIHGRDHRRGGSDPIDDLTGIQFELDNVGAWLDIRTTGTDGSSYGMHFVSSDYVKWELPTDGINGGLFHIDAAGGVLIEATGTTPDLSLSSSYNATVAASKGLRLTGGVDAVAGAGAHLQASHGDVGIVSSLGDVVVQGTGSIVLQAATVAVGGLAGITDGVQLNIALKSGNTLVVKDHLGVTIFMVDEATGNTHTHGAVVADL
jgi:hypothetical protein